MLNSSVRYLNNSVKLFSYARCGFSYNYSDAKNPQVYLTISRNGEPLGKMVFELYKNHCPKTAENFRSLCAGDNTKGYTYKKSAFHRIINNFMAQGGDFTAGNGTGGLSIYGAKFPDENMTLRHFKRGQLSMANAGPNTNGSQFFITFAKTDWLDGYHCVFGELIEGDDVLRKMELAGSRSGTPSAKFVIEDSGEVKPAAEAKADSTK